MKELKLIHELTPPALKDNCQALEDLLNQQNDIDEAELLQLVTKRDELLLAYIDAFKDDEAKRVFLEAEIPLHNALTSEVQSRLTNSGQLLGKIVKGRKAVNKYNIG